MFGVTDFLKSDNLQYVFNNLTYQRFEYVGIAIGVFVLFMFLKKIFTNNVFKIILRLVSKTKFSADTKVVTAFQKPVTNFFGVLGFYFAFKILTFAQIPINNMFIDKIFSCIVIVLISWGLYNLTDESSLLFDKMHTFYDIKVDKILFPFISKTLRLVIVAIAITIVAEKWGYDIQGFVTGLGLGGLAFALAAKDVAANIIAGIFIILDKPFSVGDWISSDNLEGTVESISFRTTKIRTFEQALITVPNSKLANEPVTNFSRRGKRRVNFNLAITYGTSKEKLQICVEKIRNMIDNHPQVNKDILYVSFDKFNVSSLDIFIYFFVDTPELAQYLIIKENINFNIMEILQQEGVSMALPSTRVYFKNPHNIRKENDFKLVNTLSKKETAIENFNESDENRYVYTK